MKLIYSDKEIVDGILRNDSNIIEYFFFNRCSPMFAFIISKIFNNRAEKDELVNELFLYLNQNDWYKIRQFDFKSKLTTWVSVVAVRFFIRKKNMLIENDGTDDSILNKNIAIEYSDDMDVETLIGMMRNERYRNVVKALIIEEREPQEFADEMDITVDNLYNIKRRAIKQIKDIVINNYIMR